MINRVIYKPAYYTGGFPRGSVVKSLPTNAEDMGAIPESGRSLEKKLATDSSIFAWTIPWTEGSDGLQTMGAQKSQMWVSN